MPDTGPLRAITRRVKLKALEEAEFVLNHKDTVDKELWNQTFLTVLKNSVPRTQEVTGEDGEPVKLVFDPVFKKDKQSNEEQTVSDM